MRGCTWRSPDATSARRLIGNPGTFTASAVMSSFRPSMGRQSPDSDEARRTRSWSSVTSGRRAPHTHGPNCPLCATTSAQAAPLCA